MEDAFPDNWKETYALSVLRVTGNVPLKRAKDSREKLYNWSVPGSAKGSEDIRCL
ncbi:MAG: hypothetical protein ACE14P_06075 [Methanotrichaceae archaeon]